MFLYQSRSSTRILLCVVILFALATLPVLSLAPFASRGEAREALLGKDVFEHANWILPRGYNNEVASKPILFYWLVALASKIQGAVNEFSTRLPSCLASIGFLLFFGYFLRSQDQTKQGLHGMLALVILASSLEWLRYSVNARVDMVFSVCLAAALICAYKYIVFGSSIIWPIMLLTLATLTKGPVALVLPCIIISLYVFSTTRRFIDTAVISLKIISAPVILSCIWYLAAYQQAGAEFLNTVLSENFSRFGGTLEGDPHKHSAPYLYLTALIGTLPWSLCLVVKPPKLKTLKFKEFWRNQTELEKFCFITLISFFVFFSIPESKRSVYLLPIYPFIALLLAGRIDYTRLKPIAVILLSIVFSSSLALLYVINGHWLDRFNFAAEYLKSSTFTYILLATLSTLCAVLLVKRYRFEPVYYLFLATLSLAVLAIGVIHPAYSYQLSSKNFAVSIKDIITKQTRLYSYRYNFYGLGFYLNHPVYETEQPQALKSGDYLLVMTKDMAQFKLEHKLISDFEVVVQAPNQIDKPKGLALLLRRR